MWLLNQRVCFFLSDHSWLKFHQIISFLLRPQYLHIADWEVGGGAACLSLGPLAILDQVKGLPHLYSIVLRAFVYFKERKMRNFREMDGLWDQPQWWKTRLDQHSRWSHLKGTGTKIENIFKRFQRKSAYICQSVRIFTIRYLDLRQISLHFFPFFLSFLIFFLIFPHVLSPTGSVLLCGYRDRSWIPFCPLHSLPLAK